MNGSVHRFGARHALWAVGAGAVLITLGACGGSSPGYSAPPAAPATGLAPAPSSTSMPPMATSTPGQPGASTAAPVATNTVMIQNFAFAPSSIAVKVGAAVTWTNGDEDPHTVTATGGAFHSSALTNGAKFSHTFTTAGTFTYMCTIHPFMHATVVVTP